MSLFTRIAATVKAGVEESISQIENHDAVIEASLKETREAASKARVRLGRVHKDGEKMRSRLDKLITDEQRWADRARSIADTDEQRALECVRRRRQCQSQIESLSEALVEHEAVESRLADSVRKIESRLQEVAEARNALRSRESVAQANRYLRNIDHNARSEIDDTLERWEIRVGADEFSSVSYDCVDSLEAEFSDEEEISSLRDELDDLRDA